MSNELSEFMNMPKKEEEPVSAVDRTLEEGFYLEYNASDPTCNLPYLNRKAL